MEDRSNEILMGNKLIICPVDFTEVASKAVEYSCLFAQKMKADLLMLHVVDDRITPTQINGGSPFSAPGGYDKMVNNKLEVLRNDCEFRYGINVRTEIEYGTLENMITLVAAAKGAELIVMGTTGASGVKEIFSGTNTIKVIEKTTCPVLVIPEEAEFTIPNYWVYAADIEKNNKATAEKIWEFCTLFDAKLDLLHVTKKSGDESKHKADLGLLNQEIQDKLSFEEIEGKNVLKAINRYIGEKEPDILAVAEHDHKKWDWLFKEDKISKIVENANFPILVIHEKSANFPDSR